MTTFFKKAVSGILLATVILSSSLGVFAETADTSTVNVANIRVFNEGAEISVILSGDAGDLVSVLMLEPNVNLPNMSTDYNVFEEGIAHANTVILDEEGKNTYKYVAEKPGMYTVRVTGAAIDYTATNNAPPTTNSERIYVEAWSPTGEYTHPDLNYRLILKKAELDEYGAETVAKRIWAKLKDQPEGRRAIYLWNDLSPKTLSGGERIWWDEGVVETKKVLGEFFEAYRNIEGSELDFIFSDTEQTFTMFSLTGLANSGDADKYAEFLEIIGEIAAGERFPEFYRELKARGYDISSDGTTPLKSICNYYNPSYNYLKFNTVSYEYAARYLKEAYYETAKSFFPNIKYCDYGMGNGKYWLGSFDGPTHPVYIGGNTSGSGTHSTMALYTHRAKSVIYNDFYGILGTDGATVDKKILLTTYNEDGSVKVQGIRDKEHGDYGEMLGAVAILRRGAKANEEGKIIPWVSTDGFGTESFTDLRYQNEMFLHIALHNPDRLLYFNSNESAEQAENLMTALDEANEFVAYSDRRSLNYDQADLYIPFLVSGMYANGRNIWRITPDTVDVATADFKISADGEDPTFAGDGVTVTFPGGSIVTPETTPVSDIGFWVETPEGVTPIFEYSENLGTEEARIDFYDVKYGQTAADLSTAETVDAVASYKNFYGDKMNFIAAKYDENGMLIDIESKECGVYSPNGNAVFLGIGKELDTKSIKFFLWEDETIRPLATNTID